MARHDALDSARHWRQLQRVEPHPLRAALGRVFVLSFVILGACSDPAAEEPQASERPRGVDNDTNALVHPPEWPRNVRWSESIASEQPVATDVDGDGTLDLVLLGRGANIGYWARGTGAGDFDAPVLIHSDRLAAAEHATLVADVNGDGRSDIVYLSTLSNNDAPRRARVTSLLSLGDGRFEPRVSNFDGYVGPLAATDLNGDGLTDLVVACPGSNQEPSPLTYLFPLLGQGDGTFRVGFDPPQRLDGLSATQLLLAPIYDEEDSALLVVGHDAEGRGSLSIHGTKHGRIGRSQLRHVLDEKAPQRALAADLDGDGLSELLFFSASARSLTGIRFEREKSALAPVLLQRQVEGDSYALSDGFAVADIDADGTPDLLLPGSDTRSTEGFRFGPVLIVAFGDGAGHFEDHRVLQLAARDGEFGAQAFAADLDDDGALDLTLSTYGSTGSSGRTGVLLGPLR